jgi:hypothetical protein
MLNVFDVCFCSEPAAAPSDVDVPSIGAASDGPESHPGLKALETQNRLVKMLGSMRGSRANRKRATRIRDLRGSQLPNYQIIQLPNLLVALTLSLLLERIA